MVVQYIPLFDYLLKNGRISQEILYSYGFDDTNIQTLLEHHILAMKEDSFYCAGNVEDLVQFAIQNYAQKKYGLSNKVLELCYSLDPGNSIVNRQLLFQAIYRKDSQAIFQYFDVFYANLLLEKRYGEANYYLLLLSLLYPLPERYVEVLKSIDLDSLLENSSSLEDNVRIRVFSRSYNYAFQSCNNWFSSLKKCSVEDCMKRDLVHQIYHEYQNLRKRETSFLDNNQWDELRSLLEEKKKLNFLSTVDLSLSHLVDEYFHFQEVGTLSQPMYTASCNSFKLIQHNQYDRAYDSLVEFYRKGRRNYQREPLYMALQKILQLVHSKLEETCESDLTSSDDKNLSHDLYSQALEGIFYNQMDTVLSYLKTIGKEHYLFLISDLRKLSELNGDLTLLDPISVLMRLKDDSFVFDLDSYVSDFKQYIVDKDFDQARVCLDIVHQAGSLGFHSRIEHELVEMLSQAEENIHRVKKRSSLTPDELKYLEQVIQRVQNGESLVLMPLMNEQKREEAFQILHVASDIVAFDIGTGPDRRIAVRYAPHDLGSIAIKSVLKEAKAAFYAKDYQSALECYQLILQIQEPRDFVYAGYARCLLKLKRKKEAIDYFTVATDVSRKTGRNMDFSDYVLRLQGMIEKENLKPNIRVSLADFQEDRMFHQDFDFLDDLVALIQSGDVSLKDACLRLHLSDEQILYVELIYARDCYYLGEYDMGDAYLKKVEKSKNKNPSIINLLEEIRKNKKFYKNRINDQEKCLVFRK